ncbi:energy transducer TonB [Aliikangiella sp. G2MR2-5]|uniref:energy transducer TonB n=1 Tax=Aliikangiella sp. G2MR2-5 TaxID=2788943 RepID=UPI0018A94603|nr:energy transducer TonB [Aliikangiella sp. G2MR2-5]
MQNHHGTIDNQVQAKVSQVDKMMFCAFLALAFHALLLFGVVFTLPDLKPSKYEKSFNVVLAQFAAEKKPEKADFIGQSNQEGGGDSEDLLMPSTKEMAQFNDPNALASEPMQQPAASQTQNSSNEFIASRGNEQLNKRPLEQTENSQQVPDTASLINKSYQLSGLIANLDSQNVNQARKARVRHISASIHRSSDALYLDSWRRKIENVGNLNYPEKAKKEKIYGNLTLKVALNKDGTIHNLKIVKSSGKKLLDDAALRIVRMSAPFPPLTPEMTKDTDILEIIRVWRFQPDYSLKTN